MGNDSRIEVFGFPVTPRTPFQRRILFVAIGLFALALLARGCQVSRNVDARIDRLAGFDVPADMKPAWRRRQKWQLDTPPTLTMGYRLGEAQARELLRTCEQTGGERIGPDEVATRFPQMQRWNDARSPACLRSETHPSRAASMLQGTRLVIRIENHGD